MRKIIIFVTIILSIFCGINQVFAEEIGSESARPRSEYTLAYSGILPDNPLYFLKAARDRITAFFISKPLKKAEFNLLQSDKRVEASYRLSEKGKSSLSESTFSKAENYFSESIGKTEDAKAQGINVVDFSSKLSEAEEKYKLVFDDIKSNLGDKEKSKFSKDRNRLYDFEKRVKKLSK